MLSVQGAETKRIAAASDVVLLAIGENAYESGEARSKTNFELDDANTPLYPFGLGLSYTEFAYSNLKVDVSGTLPDIKVEVSIDISNTGKRAGEEVVQLYINDPVASRARPMRELKRFRKVMLRPETVAAPHRVPGTRSRRDRFRWKIIIKSFIRSPPSSRCISSQEGHSVRQLT